MRNLLLDQYATADIDQFVGKVLSDLGNPDPPLKLAEVRELLRLGKAFYSSTHDSAIREVAHKLKVAGQPVLARPTILKDIIGKLGLKALLLPDRRRILIDSEVPGQKQRWSEAHQIGHDVIPWHADTMLGDNKSTLHQHATSRSKPKQTMRPASSYSYKTDFSRKPGAFLQTLTPSKY